MQSCIRLQRLVLNGCSSLTDVTISAIATNLPLLADLEISGLAEVTDASMEQVRKTKVSRLQNEVLGVFFFGFILLGY